MKLMPVVVADIANLSVVILALLIMTYVSYKVYKFTNMNDKALFLMIIFLDLTLVGKTFGSMASLKIYLYSLHYILCKSYSHAH